MAHQESPFACNMTAFSPAERKAHIAAISEVFGAVKEIRELPNGYSFRVTNETPMLLKLADFIAKERLCCPFFGFSLHLEPEGGELWLSLTGSDGVKPFIQAEIGLALSKALAWPATPLTSEATGERRLWGHHGEPGDRSFG